MDPSKFLTHEYSKEDKKRIDYNNSVAKMKKSEWDYTDLKTEKDGVVNRYYQTEINMKEFDIKSKLGWYFSKLELINKKWVDDISTSFNNLIYQFRKSKNTAQVNFNYIHKFYQFIEGYLRTKEKIDWYNYYYFAGNYIGLMIDYLLFSYDVPKDEKEFADTFTTYFFDSTKGDIQEIDFINYKILINFLELRNSKPSGYISFIEDTYFTKKLIYQFDWVFENFKKNSIQNEIKKTWNRLKNPDAKKDLLTFILHLNKKKIMNSNNLQESASERINFEDIENKINCSMSEIFSTKLNEFQISEKDNLKGNSVDKILENSNAPLKVKNMVKQLYNNYKDILI